MPILEVNHSSKAHLWWFCTPSPIALKPLNFLSSPDPACDSSFELAMPLGCLHLSSKEMPHDQANSSCPAGSSLFSPTSGDELEYLSSFMVSKAGEILFTSFRFQYSCFPIRMRVGCYLQSLLVKLFLEASVFKISVMQRQQQRYFLLDIRILHYGGCSHCNSMSQLLSISKVEFFKIHSGL